MELDRAWVEHDGDDLAWAVPDFDDSQWNGVNLEDLGPAQTGWHWYRQRVKLGPDHTAFISVGSRRAFRYFRAVFTSIPAFDAAISCVSSVIDNLKSLLICWSVTIRKALSWNTFRIVSTHFR